MIRVRSLEIRPLAIVCGVLAATGSTLGVLLSPESISRYASRDGVLSDHTREWLICYRNIVWFIAAAFAVTAIVVARSSFWRERANRLAPRMAIAFVSIMVTMSVLEIVCRTLERSEVRARGERDVAAGAREFMQRVSTQHNVDGFRDEPFTRDRSTGETRVLVIGDSFAYGFGVEDRAATFPARLEVELRVFTPADVFNAAVPGADTARELAIARATIERVDPDLVLIAWHVNDAESEADKRAYVEQSRAVPLISDVLLRKSALWRVVEPALVSFAIDRGWKRSYVEHLRALHDPPTGQRWSQRREFEELLDESRAGGRRVVVVLFPLVEDFRDDPLRDVHGVVERACEARGVPCFDLLSKFEHEEAASLQVDAFDHHLNEKGNALAARAVADFVKTTGLLSLR